MKAQIEALHELKKAYQLCDCGVEECDHSLHQEYCQYRTAREKKDCPLCKIAETMKKDPLVRICGFCPWTIITGEGCLAPENNYETMTITDRLAQIDEWIIRLEEKE